jgi:DNA polymerase-3 subunit gamma/tau
MSERGKLALYRKYRPKKLDGIIGQPQVTDILKAAVEKQIIGHAYLFSGPRGTGKTSAARILAHEFNQISYADDSLNLDIIEIDAASNRRIEDIRDLREVVKLAPTKAKYKIYIIDEVHMLTTESFNALLKTLEEPPEHAIFILATTDLHKVPPTILSRTQKFTFKLLSVDELAQHLASICKKEGIKAGKDALSLIAELGGGSVRDAISILDQLQSLGEEITENLVRDVMGMPSAKLQTEVQQALENYDSAKLLSLTSQMMETGANQKEIIKNLISSLVKMPKTTNLHLKLIDDLADALNAYDPLLFLNIALLKFNPNIEQVELGKPKIVTPKVSAQQPVSAEKDSAVAERLPKRQTETNEDKPEKINEAVVSDLPSDEAELKPAKPATSNLKFSGVTWQKVLQEVKSKSASTYAMMRLSQAEVDGDNLNVVFKFEFHKKKMDEGKNRQALIDALKRVINTEPQLKYSVDKDVKLGSTSLGAEGETQDISPDQSSILGKISNIMGGGEVVNEDE